jgi:hypothetical protein
MACPCCQPGEACQCPGSPLQLDINIQIDPDDWLWRGCFSQFDGQRIFQRNNNTLTVAQSFVAFPTCCFDQSPDNIASFEPRLRWVFDNDVVQCSVWLECKGLPQFFASGPRLKVSGQGPSNAFICPNPVELILGHGGTFPMSLPSLHAFQNSVYVLANTPAKSVGGAQCPEGTRSYVWDKYMAGSYTPKVLGSFAFSFI